MARGEFDLFVDRLVTAVIDGVPRAFRVHRGSGEHLDEIAAVCHPDVTRFDAGAVIESVRREDER